MNKPVDFNDSGAPGTTATCSDPVQLDEAIDPGLGEPAAEERPEVDAFEESVRHLAGLVEETRRWERGEQADEGGNDTGLDEHVASGMDHLDGMPADFIVTNKGVFWRDPTKRKGNAMYVCAPLRVTALVRDIASMNWGRVLRFFDADGLPHEWVAPMTMLIGDGVEICRELARQGLEIATGVRARAMLVQYISSCKPQSRGRCVQKTGWFQNVFVLPDRTLRNAAEDVIYQSERTGTHYAQSGTLDAWQCRVSHLCAGNSRLTLAICAAFAGPLLHFAGHDSGGIHFVGPSSIGKTTLLGVGASVFGGTGFIQTWRATSNGLEGLCELRNDTLLVLDEMGEVDSKDAGDIAYMIGNGVGKTRSDRNGDARCRKTWRLMFLSSGEVGLAQHMSEGGKVARVGQEVRLIDLPADAGAGHGVFENLHGFKHGGALSNALREATRRCHGVAGVEFIEALPNDHGVLSAFLKTFIEGFVDMYLPKDAGGQATRVCFRFALMAAAGEMATAYGVTGWKSGTANEAAATCFQTWLEQRGGAGNSEREKILSAVRAFFETHGDARFAELGSRNERVTINRMGFRARGDDGGEFYVLPEAYKREVCAGFDQRTVTKVLINEGWLQPGKDRKSAQKRSLPDLGETRVYVITAAMWRGDGPN